MTFTYDYISDDTSNKLFTSMTNKLNLLNKNRRRSVKIATNDVKGGTAKGVLIYCNENAPNKDSLKNSWLKKSWSNSATGTNIKSCIDFLNGDEITDTQKYYSRIGISNVSGGNSYLVIFY